MIPTNSKDLSICHILESEIIVKLEQCFAKTLDAFCVCVKRKTLCNCLCYSSCYSTRIIRNIREFRAKTYFEDHQTANTTRLFVPMKMKFFRSILFQNKLQQWGIPQRLLYENSDLVTCMSLKWALSRRQKPPYTDIKTNSLCCSA